MARLEAERAIIAEQQAQEDLKLRQAEMQAQLQRQKDIEAGLIDLEEEARQKREKEEKERAEAAEKQRKTQAKLQAIELNRSQQDELEALKREQLAKSAEPKKSMTPIIAIAAALVLMIGGGIAAFFLLGKEAVDPYALSEQYETRDISFLQETTASITMATPQIVTQAEPVKAAPKHSGKKKSGGAAPAEPAAKPKVSLSGGAKGGLFGNKKL